MGRGRCVPGPQVGDEGGPRWYVVHSGFGTEEGLLVSTGVWSFPGTALVMVPLLFP